MKVGTRMALLLVLMVLLYGVSLGIGLRPGAGAPPDVDAGDRWLIAALGTLRGPFAPRLDLKSLRCNGQTLDGTVTLRPQAPTCEVHIPADADDREYRHATLQVLKIPPDFPAVYVRAQFDEKQFPQAKRNRAECILDGEAALAPFRLEARYRPAGEQPDDLWECWLKKTGDDESISLTVLKEGGTLQLACVGCDPAVNRQLSLRAK